MGPRPFGAVLLLLMNARRRPPLLLGSVLALLLGFVVADLTHAWRVTPVWAPILALLVARSHRGRRRRSA